MRKLVEFQILDVNAVHYGYDLFELMKNAGNNIAEYISELVSKETPIIFACGSGNNGGDGYIAASILQDKGYTTKIFAVSNPKSQISIKAASGYSGEIFNFSDFPNVVHTSFLIVDCLLGSGVIGSPRAPFNEIIKTINKYENILAVDVPSGFGTNLAVKPKITITFHDKKLGMTKKNCGKIVVSDIGFSKDIDQKTGPGELLLYPKFDSKKHKGQNGKVAIVGGGPYSGAPALAGLGAYRSGVDLVDVFVPESSYQQVSSFAPELIVHKLEGEIVTSEVIKYLDRDKYDSIVVGPGMGKNKDSILAVQKIIDKFDNVVIDADAIVNYDFRNSNIIITPHRGELSRLKINNKKKEMMKFAKDSHLTLFLKGERDMITDGHYYKINNTGHPRMAVGGTGDLLSGLCGGLLAKGLSPFEASRLAAYSFGKAGEMCYEEYGAGFLPSDLGLCISRTLV